MKEETRQEIDALKQYICDLQDRVSNLEAGGEEESPRPDSELLPKHLRENDLVIVKDCSDCFHILSVEALCEKDGEIWQLVVDVGGLQLPVECLSHMAWDRTTDFYRGSALGLRLGDRVYSSKGLGRIYEQQPEPTNPSYTEMSISGKEENLGVGDWFYVISSR